MHSGSGSTDHRTRWRRGAVVLLALLVARSAHAAAEAPKALTLDEALAFARAHQPLIRSALARVAAREREARVPRAAWLPQLGATAQLLAGTANNTTASYLGVPEVDLPRIGGTRSTTDASFLPYGSSLVAVTLDQEVYDFGRIAAQAAVLDALAEAARADADAARLDVDLAVEEAFEAVLAGKAVLVAASDAVKRATAHRDFAEAGVKSGLRPPVDLTRAGADLADAEVRRVRAEAGLAAARNALAASIGSEDTAVDAVDGGRGAPSGSPGLDEALRRAARSNPALVLALARLRADEARTRAIGRELWPNLFASATLSARAGGAPPSSGDVPFGQGWLPDVLNWHAGLVLQWNVFDATVLARRDAARAHEEASRADLDLARNALTLQVERAWLDLDAALRAVPALVAAGAAAEANLKQADARFRAGLGTGVELADAEALLTRAQVDLAVGRFGVARAQARLARAIGERR